jgi:hypothetical protein
MDYDISHRKRGKDIFPMRQTWTKLNMCLAVVLVCFISSHCSIQTAWAGFDRTEAGHDCGERPAAFQKFDSAAQKKSTVQRELTQMDTRGRNASQDYDEAAKECGRAILKDDSDYAFFLTYLYGNKQGLERDYYKFHLWIFPPVERSHCDSAEFRSFLLPQ